MKNVAVFIIGLIWAVSAALAVDVNDLKEKPRLGIQLDVTWVSKYIWHGQDLYEDHAGFQPSFTLDLFQTGFSTGVWASSACSSGFVDYDELDYWVAYSNSFFNDKRYQLDYEIKWTYYDYYRMSSDEADEGEFDFTFSFPNLLPFGVVPSYTLSYLYAAKSDSPVSEARIEGFLHTFGLNYEFNIPKTEIPLILTWDITYNDGQGGPEFAHDWAYTTFGISTYKKIGPGTFTPAVYFQKTLDESTNFEDEIWCSLSYTLDF